MNTIDQIVHNLESFKTPIWSVLNGTAKVSAYDSEDLNGSIQFFQDHVSRLPPGKYRVSAHQKVNGGKSAFNWELQIGQTAVGAVSWPAYAPAAAVHGGGYSRESLMNEVKTEIYLNEFREMLPRLKNALSDLEKIKVFLQDLDGDGQPDFFQTQVKEIASSAAKKAVNKVTENFFN